MLALSLPVVALGMRPRRLPDGDQDVFKVTMVRDESSRMVLKLEGRLSDSWVDELARVAEAAMNDGAQVTFDLDGLSFVDVRGLTLLRGAAERGAQLTGGSTFVTALMERERRP